MNRDSFVFHREWYDAIKELDSNVRFEIYDAIVAEAFELDTKQLSPLAQMAMKFIRQRLNNDKVKYESICRRNSANGAKGGRPKKTQINPENPVGILETQENPEKPKKADNDIQDTKVSMSISNNIEKEKDTNVSKNKKISYPDEFESDWNLYGRKGSKKDSYTAWKVLSDDDRIKMRSHIPHYLQSNERQYLKDFERYIKHRVFESPVYHKSNLLFDPQTIENNEAGVYDPSGWLNYDESFNAWRYFGREPKYDLRDGYTDENRPDGARVVTQATVYLWSAANKNWSLTK